MLHCLKKQFQLLDSLENYTDYLFERKFQYKIKIYIKTRKSCVKNSVILFQWLSDHKLNTDEACICYQSFPKS
ncbi:hypothetical protein BpHYR1_027869 [Brachionus plicatilis]|uniref:Uncharacterized protein n=1 Tax=Brachionus plicatilis TaxID=10195 RepID=A0A3M7SAW5_BRAPC|nr:hypothetical protein BpHYR1_027869 [Brachionus plicatilis]